MLEEVALPADILGRGARARYPALDPVRTGHELLRRQITRLVEDVIVTTRAALEELAPQSPEDVHAAGRTIVTFSTAMAAREKELKAFLYRNVYRHPDVMKIRAGADQIVRDLFDAYFADPRAMPDGWREGLDARRRAHPSPPCRRFPRRHDRHLRGQGTPAPV